MAAKKKITNTRSGRQQPASRKQAAQGSADILSVSLKDMDASFEERVKRHKRSLEEHHQSKAQDAEFKLRSRVTASRRFITARRAAQIKRLRELIKKRAEIESLILVNVERWNDSYKYAANDLQVLVNSAGGHL